MVTGSDPVNEHPLSLRFVSAGATHTGRVRTLNEDSLLIDDEAGIWAVADGVGGHDAGDYASRLITSALGRIGPQHSAAALLAAARERVVGANADLLAFAANEGVEVVASTIAVLLCFGGHFAALWAGDSRIYRMRDGVLTQLTRDHSAVQELVDKGVMSAAEAAGDRRANVITRAVGAEEALALDVSHDRLVPGDRFLLCSDGLTKVMADDEIAARLADPAIASVPDRLIDVVLERGAPDNVTAVVVGCLAEEPPPEPGAAASPALGG